MKIAVIGAGGVGGFFGGKLAHARHDVTFLARGRHLQAMKENGLQVKSIDGDFRVDSVKATEQIAELGSPDLIIVALKAWQVKEVRDGLRDILHQESLVLPLQNGVLAAEELSEVLGEHHVLGGLCRIISMIESPGVIKHFGAQPSVVVGELSGEKTARSIEVVEVLRSSGIHTKHSDNVQIDLWKKFIFICVGGLEAISRTTNGEMRSHPETRELMIDLLRENWRLAQAAGIAVPESYVEDTIRFIDALPEDATFSMARDIWEGRPSELEYLNGAIVSLAKEYGADVPINTIIYHSLLPMERKARS